MPTHTLTFTSFKQWAHENSRALRLAASYLLVIMVMSIGFSFIFYRTSVQEFNRQLPPRRLLYSIHGDYYDYNTFLQERLDEARSSLLDRLLVLNVLTLLLGSIPSYYLARRTLAPIEQAMEAQARFASDASHELRTPLAAMQTENEVALRNPSLTLDRAKELLQSNLEEVIRLRGLAEGLLRLARDNDMPATLAPVPLEKAVHEAVANVQKIAQKKSITITADVPAIRVHSNESNLVQVIKILLDNAIKYSDEHTAITISAVANNGEVLLSVRDQGIGIGEDDIGHIFERFYRADPSRSKNNVEGNGLGLALASAIMKQLGGYISVQSQEGKGSTFTLHLRPAATRHNKEQ